MAGQWPDCPHCGREYRYRVNENEEAIPPCCGEPLCRAKQYWTDEQWAGRARMAESAIAGGHRLVPHTVLDEKGEPKSVAERVPYIPTSWDREALRRAGAPHCLMMLVPFVRAFEDGWLWMCRCGSSDGCTTRDEAFEAWGQHQAEAA